MKKKFFRISGVWQMLTNRTVRQAFSLSGITPYLRLASQAVSWRNICRYLRWNVRNARIGRLKIPGDFPIVYLLFSSSSDGTVVYVQFPLRQLRRETSIHSMKKCETKFRQDGWKAQNSKTCTRGRVQTNAIPSGVIKTLLRQRLKKS